MDAFVGVLVVVVLLAGLTLLLFGGRGSWDKTVLRLPGGRSEEDGDGR